MKTKTNPILVKMAKMAGALLIYAVVCCTSLIAQTPAGAPKNTLPIANPQAKNTPAATTAPAAEDPEEAAPLFEQLNQELFPLSTPVPEKPDPKRLYKEAIQKIADFHIALAEKAKKPSDAPVTSPEEAHGATKTAKQVFLEKWGEPNGPCATLEEADKLIALALESLGFRFDGYMPPKAVEAMKNMADPTSVGIGVSVKLKGQEELLKALPEDASKEQVEKALTISSEHPLELTPIKGGPAEKAGIKAGDIVKAVDGKSVDGQALAKTIPRIKGKKGTEVELTIERQVSGKTEEVKIKVTRDEFTVSAVDTKDLGDGTWYVSLSSFMPDNAAKDMQEALKKAVDAKATKLIFDLRGNGGGRLDHGINIAQYLLPEGTIAMLYRRDAGTGKLVYEEHHAAKHTMITTYPEDGGLQPVVLQRVLVIPPSMPIVVLIDENTASASELVSGCLKHYGRAKFVGVRSHGKGVGQQVIDLPYGRQIKITNFQFRPGDDDIDHVGIPVDVEVEFKKGDVDNQLEAAKKLVDEMYRDGLARTADEKAKVEGIRRNKLAEWEKLKAERDKAREKEKADKAQAPAPAPAPPKP